MSILVTGGSGHIGRYVVRELVEHGHEVLSIDVQPQPDAPCRTLRVDVTEAGEVYQALALAKADAVIHLAAWANAGMVASTRTYGDNVQGTFNVFQACLDLGIKRVIWASSAHVYGFASAPPLYVPVDEEHPLRPVNCYALSKMAGEQAADYFVANYGMTILSFRFMGVRTPRQIAPEIQQMVQDPASGSSLLWTRTDARDAAMACRLALEKERVPSGPYNITGAEVVLFQSTRSLIAEHFGDQTDIQGTLAERASPLSCARAAAAFAYRPHYVWTENRHFPE